MLSYYLQLLTDHSDGAHYLWLICCSLSMFACVAKQHNVRGKCMNDSNVFISNVL